MIVTYSRDLSFHRSFTALRKTKNIKNNVHDLKLAKEILKKSFCVVLVEKFW